MQKRLPPRGIVPNYLEKLANNHAPSDFELYAKIVRHSFSETVIEPKGRIMRTATKTFLVRLKHAKTTQETEKKQPELFIIDLSAKKELGRGIHCVAEAVKEIISGKEMVLKNAILEANRETIAQVLNMIRHSKRVLKELNQAGTTSGIQKKPYATIGLTNPPGNQQVKMLMSIVGTLEPRYDSELFDRIEAIGDDREHFWKTQSERFQIGKQLLEGLVAIHSKGYTHGDLKLDNALIQGQGEEILVHISDFGNAKSMNEENPPLDPSGIYTIDYNLESDMDLEEEAFHDKNWKLLHFYQTKRDLFEMGVLLAKCLTANDPFDSNPDEFIELDRSCLDRVIRKMWQKPLSVKILDLLNQMLNPSPLMRPTAEKALRLYMELIPQPVTLMPSS